MVLSGGFMLFISANQYAAFLSMNGKMSVLLFVQLFFCFMPHKRPVVLEIGF